MTKPYLLSIGVGLPLAGLWGHYYFDTKRKWKLRSVRFLGIHVVIACYRKTSV